MGSAPRALLPTPSRGGGGGRRNASCQASFSRRLTFTAVGSLALDFGLAMADLRGSFRDPTRDELSIRGAMMRHGAWAARIAAGGPGRSNAVARRRACDADARGSAIPHGALRRGAAHAPYADDGRLLGAGQRSAPAARGEHRATSTGRDWRCGTTIRRRLHRVRAGGELRGRQGARVGAGAGSAATYLGSLSLLVSRK